MNLQAIAEAINKNFPGQITVTANERGSLTIDVQQRCIDVDPEGNVYNVIDKVVTPPAPPVTDAPPAP